MKTRRVLASLATGAAALLTLTGCISFDLGVSVNADSTASFTASVSYDKEKIAPLLAATGQEIPNLCDFLKDQQSESVDSAEVTQEWSETDKACVQTIKSTRSYAFDENGLKDSDLEDSGPAAGLQIVRVGDQAKVTFDTSSLTSGLEGEGGGQFSWDMILTGFDLHVTFPGAVSEASHDGKLSDGNRTVSWDIAALKASAASSSSLTATGSLVESAGGGGLVMIIAIILGVLVVGGAVAFLLLRGRRSGAALQSAAAAPGTVVDPAPGAPAETDPQG